MQTRAFPFLLFREWNIVYYERETLKLNFIGGIIYEKDL